MDMPYHFLVFADGSIEQFLSRINGIVMALHADAVNGHALGTHPSDHLTDTLALHGVGLVVVVIEQQGVGVGLAGILESLTYEILTGNLI